MCALQVYFFSQVFINYNNNNSGLSSRSTAAIMHVALGEEVGGAKIASAPTPPQKGGSCPAYRGPVQ